VSSSREPRAMLSIAATSLPAFTAPLLPHAMRVAAPVMKAEGEIGVTPPLGVWDPLLHRW